jgi:hypothetical protein
MFGLETVEEPGEDLRVVLTTIRGLRHLLTGAVRETVDLTLDNPTVPLEDLDVMRVHAPIAIRCCLAGKLGGLEPLRTRCGFNDLLGRT